MSGPVNALKIELYVELDPGYRFHGLPSGSCYIDGEMYQLSTEFGCGTLIMVGEERYRLAPEMLIAAIHEARHRRKDEQVKDEQVKDEQV